LHSVFLALVPNLRTLPLTLLILLSRVCTLVGIVPQLSTIIATTIIIIAARWGALGLEADCWGLL
jgi:hypothetical protein